MERLAKEVATMLSFEHPNVMSLVGVCIEEEIPLLIIPFMSNGCVLEFVKHHRDELLCINATAPQVESVFSYYSLGYDINTRNRSIRPRKVF